MVYCALPHCTKQPNRLCVSSESVREGGAGENQTQCHKEREIKYCSMHNGRLMILLLYTKQAVAATAAQPPTICNKRPSRSSTRNTPRYKYHRCRSRRSRRRSRRRRHRRHHRRRHLLRHLAFSLA
jgi:hypothetical protein